MRKITYAALLAAGLLGVPTLPASASGLPAATGMGMPAVDYAQFDPGRRVGPGPGPGRRVGPYERRRAAPVRRVCRVETVRRRIGGGRVIVERVRRCYPRRF